MNQTGSAGAAIYSAVPHASKGRGHMQACAVASKPRALQQLKAVLSLFPPLSFPTHLLVELMAMALARLSTEVLASV